MTSQALFWMTIGIGGFTLLIFFVGRKGFVEPTKLNLRKDLEKKNRLPSTGSQSPGPISRTSADLGMERDDANAGPIKNLNIIFIYNGHSFDAYEVLGAPAGASFALVEKFYQDCLKREGHDRDFLFAAFEAIRSSK